MSRNVIPGDRCPLFYEGDYRYRERIREDRRDIVGLRLVVLRERDYAEIILHVSKLRRVIYSREGYQRVSVSEHPGLELVCYIRVRTALVDIEGGRRV